MTIALVVIIVCLAAAVLWLALRRPAAPDASFSLMQQQLDALRGQVGQSLSETTQSVNAQLRAILEQVNGQLNAVSGRLQQSDQTIGERFADVSKGLGVLGEASARILEVGRDVAKLHDILHAPKLRGGLGELLLADLLAQVLPARNYAVQHTFRSGETVDAVIHLGQGCVPVDAKFPLENFRRMLDAADDAERKVRRREFAKDVRKHIDAIAGKYILPDEGTFDFALMYIPAENVYYEIIVKDAAGEDADLAAYALQRRVVPVSPNSFYAYLQAIVLGLRGLRVEERAQEILRALDRLNGDFARFREEFAVLGKHVTNVKGRYDEAARRLDGFGDKLTATIDTRAPDTLPARAEEVR